MRKEYLFIILITIIAGALRMTGLGEKALFIDEAGFAFWSLNGNLRQEFISEFIGWIMKPQSEFWIRFQFAVAGTLTVPAVYVVTKNKWSSLLVAIFPLFIFYSRLARPYAVAGLFLVLGWRWYGFYALAILETPISLIGVKLHSKKWILIGAVILSAVTFLIREDRGRDFVSQIAYSSRFFYLPALAMILYFSNWSQTKNEIKNFIHHFDRLLSRNAERSGQRISKRVPDKAHPRISKRNTIQ